MKIKKISAVALSLTMLLSSFVSSSADSSSIVDDDLTIGTSNEEFNGVIENESSNSVKDIKIDIYSYVLEEETDEYKAFRNVYDSSVYTDSEGAYAFDRPEGAFMMKVDLSTLPDGTGISSEIIHIDEVENTTALNVDHISSVDVQVNDIVTEDILVEFKSDTEQVLYTDYNISVNPAESEALVATFANLNDTDETSGINSLDYLITVDANGLMYSETYTVDLPSDPIDKIDSLNYYQKISDDQRIVLLSEALQSDATLSIFDRIDIETEIDDYCLNNPAFVEANSSILVETYLEKPDYKDDEQKVTFGDFTIHYKDGVYSDSTLRQYASALNGAKGYFVTGYGFKAPTPTPGGKYDVYLMWDDTIKTKGTTKPQKISTNNYYSFIVLNAPLDYTTSDEYTKTIAHELFHAISYRYTYDKGKILDDSEKWFSESFANWAGLLYVGHNTDNLTGKVKKFLLNPNKSLHDPGLKADGDDKRYYGAFLFPLTIQNQYGGATTIKSIMESFAECTNGSGISYSAISKGLGKVNSDYNRSKAFVYCMVNNMFTPEYYPISNGEWDSAKRTNAYRGSTTMNGIKLAAMAGSYYDFTPSSTSKYLYVTLNDTSNNYTNINIACIKEKTNGTYYRYSKGISSSYTYEFNNFSQSASNKFTIALINSKTNAEQNLNFTATYKTTAS